MNKVNTKESERSERQLDGFAQQLTLRKTLMILSMLNLNIFPTPQQCRAHAIVPIAAVYSDRFSR